MLGNGWVMRALGERDTTWFYILPGAPLPQRVLACFGTAGPLFAVAFVLGVVLYALMDWWGAPVLLVVALYHGRVVEALLGDRAKFSHSFTPDPPGTPLLQRYWAAAAYLRACADADPLAARDLHDVLPHRQTIERDLYDATPLLRDPDAWSAATTSAAAASADAFDRALRARRRVDGRQAPPPSWTSAGLNRLTPLVSTTAALLAATALAAAVSEDVWTWAYLMTYIVPAAIPALWLATSSLRRKRQVEHILTSTRPENVEPSTTAEERHSWAHPRASTHGADDAGPSEVPEAP